MLKYCSKLLCLSLVVFLTGCSTSKRTHLNEVQNTRSAAQYFKDELAFTANPSSMKNAVKNKDSSILIIDLRKREHYKQGHVPGAINLPFDEWNNFDGSKVDFSKLDKNKMHLVYCYEHYCSLSLRAAHLFALNGYPVKEVKGGFKAYKAHNYPIE